MHGDHVGDRHLTAPNAGTCSDPDVSVKVTPNTNTVNLALATGAVIITGSEMPRFFAGKLKALGGDPKKSKLVRFGASTKVGGVTLTTVPAVHSNGVSGAFIEGDLGEMLNAAGLTAYAGPPTGYVLTFSNGLVVYLSGDTGVTAEQQTVVGRQYKPQSVIASHANEVATKDGMVIAGTKTAAFIDAVEVPVHLPLSGRTMSFDEFGNCRAGC